MKKHKFKKGDFVTPISEELCSLGIEMGETYKVIHSFSEENIHGVEEYIKITHPESGYVNKLAKRFRLVTRYSFVSRQPKNSPEV